MTKKEARYIALSLSWQCLQQMLDTGQWDLTPDLDSFYKEEDIEKIETEISKIIQQLFDKSIKLES